jgi:hypothetical protein
VDTDFQVHRALLFETPEQIFARVFQEIKPRTPLPAIQVVFQPFANANSFIRMEDGRLNVRITDLLQDAPAPVTEALAYILLSKLFRRAVPAAYSTRYRLYLNRKDTRRDLERIRQERGRKHHDGPQGEHHNLEEIFEELNFHYFHGLMSRPALGWSRNVSRTMLGHYDAPHNTIMISRLFDQPGAARVALEWVLYHEMLHLKFPVIHRGARRSVHPPEFKAAEKLFEKTSEARQVLKALIKGAGRRARGRQP